MKRQPRMSNGGLDSGPETGYNMNGMMRQTGHMSCCHTPLE